MQQMTDEDIVAAFESCPSGPMALILNEDGIGLTSTIDYHKRLGFEAIMVLGQVPETRADSVGYLQWPIYSAIHKTLNPLLPHLAGRWVMVVYNSEYFFFPFCEARSIRDVILFATEENRDAVFCTTLDLYTEKDALDGPNPHASDSYFDRAGYYARDRFVGPEKIERQKEVFGGLKWRFSEHIPWERQRIDRIALFKVEASTQFDETGRLSDAEQNTVACPWHHNLTACVASYRVAKSLATNPGSQFEIETFMWSGSEHFDWTSTQLMDRGFMEPGQWF